MLNNTLTMATVVLGGLTPGSKSRSYALRTLGPTSSTYSEISANMDVPRTIRVSHEVGAKGIVNTAIILDQQIDSGNAAVSDSVARCMVKLSYDPEFADKETLKEMLVEMALHLLVGFANDAETVDGVTIGNATNGLLTASLQSATGISLARLLNQEH